MTEYNHPDRLGTRLITNQTLGTVSEQTHLPFGRPLNAESSLTTNNRRFTSYDRSNATGLDYAINRTYDSKQGRFTQVDPIGMQAVSLASPQTLNLYAYCTNDPINYTDPSGLFFGRLFKWIGKIFKAVMKILMWVVIVVAVILVTAFIMSYTPYMLPGWLGDATGSLLGFLGKIGASAFGQALAGAIGVEVGSTVGSIITAGLVGVGAIARGFAEGKKKPKRRPGLFQTVDQAARWWLRIMNPQSIAINREIGVPICERQYDGAIIFGPYEIGTEASVRINDCPEGTKRVGSAHTHGAYSPLYDNENFSDRDRINANNRSLADGGSTPNYVATPRGQFKKFVPSAIRNSTRGRVIIMKPL